MGAVGVWDFDIMTIFSTIKVIMHTSVGYWFNLLVTMDIFVWQWCCCGYKNYLDYKGSNYVTDENSRIKDGAWMSYACCKPSSSAVSLQFHGMFASNVMATLSHLTAKKLYTDLSTRHHCNYLVRQANLQHLIYYKLSSAWYGRRKKLHMWGRSCLVDIGSEINDVTLHWKFYNMLWIR